MVDTLIEHSGHHLAETIVGFDDWLMMPNDDWLWIEMEGTKEDDELQAIEMSGIDGIEMFLACKYFPSDYEEERIIIILSKDNKHYEGTRQFDC